MQHQEIEECLQRKDTYEQRREPQVDETRTTRVDKTQIVTDRLLVDRCLCNNVIVGTICASMFREVLHGRLYLRRRETGLRLRCKRTNSMLRTYDRTSIASVATESVTVACPEMMIGHVYTDIFRCSS